MDNLIGKTLDGLYTVRELIGTGGMANVYKEKWGVYAAGVALLQSVGFWLENTTGKGGRACYENGHN